MRDLTVQGLTIPGFLYGTAWKEERTEALTAMALGAGFRGIDTANQRKHYFEAGVGDALKKSALSRSQLFLQTKFTYARGQDHRLPYDPQAPFAEQVRQSFQSSLEHLGTDHLDSYVLHGPATGGALIRADWEVWGAMSELHQAGKTRLLGVSNISVEQLHSLCEKASPAFVQNRCYARDGWDREVRLLCRERGIVYQGFSLLTANRRELSHPTVTGIAVRTGRTLPQVIFRFAQKLGMLPLTGTSDPTHMRQDLDLDFDLSDGEVAAIERISS
jgi:diketogulonate reductase-like aldo/keto reductase